MNGNGAQSDGTALMRAACIVDGWFLAMHTQLYGAYIFPVPYPSFAYICPQMMLQVCPRLTVVPVASLAYGVAHP